MKAVVLGAAGGIGQPLSLLLKVNPHVTELGLYDIVNTPGVAADLSHINTGSKIQGFLPPDNGLKKALTGANVVIIPAGVPRKPGMTRDDLFKINAGIVRDLATEIAETSPKAFILVISNPVNSTVPIVAEVLRQRGVFDPKRLFGVTTLDVVRASTFVAEKLGNPSLAPHIQVPVIGGHSGVTIVPLLSKFSHSLPTDIKLHADVKLPADVKILEEITTRVQFGGDEVVKAKDGTGSATLSMAYAGAEFAQKILRAINGETGITVPTYVNLASDPVGGKALKEELGEDLEYFSSIVELGPDGVSKILPIGEITESEQKLINAALTELSDNIQKGISFVKTPRL